MITRLCEPEHLAIIILVLLVALLVVSSGKGLGALIGTLFKRLGGKGAEVTVNVGEDMAKHDGTDAPHCPFTDPNKCPDHKAEHERSMKNESNIEKLFTAISDVKKEIRDGNERVLLALVAGGQIKPTDIPPRKQ
jgi:hypothetical protein